MPAPMVCDGCGGVLVQLGTGLYHASNGSPGCATDGVVHATSVPSGEEDYECDLCSRPGRWNREIRAKSFTSGFLGEEGLIQIQQSEEWAVCYQCEADLVRDDKTAIVERSAWAIRPDASPAEHAKIVEMVRGFHRQIWMGWDGKIYPSEGLPFD